VNGPDVTKLEELSPFELKNRLIALAKSHADRMMLNAGRGNPDFLAIVPRHAFFQLGAFAMGEAERRAAGFPNGVAGIPPAAGMAARFEAYLGARPDAPGIALLAAALSCARERPGGGDADIHELAQGILGCQYPEPVRMLPFCEAIVRRYLQKEMFADEPIAGAIDLFAVEGATAGIAYIFNTLRENGLLVAGDAIAIGTPIFTPYLEIPRLPDYRLVELAIAADPTAFWQYPAAELDKLLDPRVKALLLVNPGNPTAVSIDRAGLDRIAAIVATRRPDLLILSDDVYGTFADDFVSLFARCPHNTILLYSFSKYFGATGWRLGVIAVHERNVADARIATLPDATLGDLDARYGSLVEEPRRLKFIDQLVADSRAVALHHTAGLSTPQQMQMTLFALAALIDQSDTYKQRVKRLLRRRHRALYEALGIAVAADAHATDYYAILDFETLGAQLHGPGFAAWLSATKNPIDILIRLADESGVVLLPGKGFATPHPSARISLANLPEADYARIGRITRALLREYADEYRATAAHSATGR
jgi:aspartate 4-decarboxylase